MASVGVFKFSVPAQLASNSAPPSPASSDDRSVPISPVFRQFDAYDESCRATEDHLILLYTAVDEGFCIEPRSKPRQQRDNTWVYVLPLKSFAAEDLITLKMWGTTRSIAPVFDRMRNTHFTEIVSVPSDREQPRIPPSREFREALVSFMTDIRYSASFIGADAVGLQHMAEIRVGCVVEMRKLAPREL